MLIWNLTHLLWWLTVNTCPCSVCRSVSACPHRSTLPKSGHRKYGPPYVQQAHDWTSDSLIFTAYTACMCVPFWHFCLIALGVMIFFLFFLSPLYWRKSLKSICKYYATFILIYISTWVWHKSKLNVVVIPERSSMKLTLISRRRERSLMTWSPKWTATVSHLVLSL